MEASKKFVEGKATFANAEEREAVLRVYRESIATFQKQIDARRAAASGSR